MAKNYYDITLALAGVCQAARLVQQLAHQGHCDSDALHVSLNSIIDLDPESTLAVFGGSEANLRLGLETLLGVLNTSSRQGLNAELTRYTLSLMVLERMLAASKGAMDTLGNRIGGLHQAGDRGQEGRIVAAGGVDALPVQRLQAGVEGRQFDLGAADVDPVAGLHGGVLQWWMVTPYTTRFTVPSGKGLSGLRPWARERCSA